MIRMKYIVAVTTLSLVLTGCSSKPDPTQTSSAQELYTTGQQKLEEGNFRAAIKQFEALDNRYPFGPQAQQVQLNLIYAYYKSAELPMAIAAIDRFMRLNPTHPNIDYVLYMRGITTMTLDDSTIEGLLGIDRSDRDPEHARVAFRDLSQLVRYYPTSLYATDANKRLVYLKDRLAKYELSVVQYYNKRGAYVAVVNRVKQMLSDFPDTQATRNALPYMKIAYNKIGLTEEVAKTDALINSNPE